MSEGQFNALAEGSEAEFMYQYESMAPQATKASLGIATARIGSGVVLSMRHDVTGYWTKALGFGSAEPVTPELIGRVLEFYCAHSSPGAVIQIAPKPFHPHTERRTDSTPTTRGSIFTS